MKNLLIAFMVSVIPFVAHADSDDQKQMHLQCLAHNIYHEARGESLLGQIAVAFVTLNRVYSEKFPNDICSVVKQRRGNVCQFSWVCNKKLPVVEEKSWLIAKQIAEVVVNDYQYIVDPTDGSLWYHADYVKPYWSIHLKKASVIDNHIFYMEH